jgi:magnesium and cobalt transporter
MKKRLIALSERAVAFAGRCKKAWQLVPHADALYETFGESLNNHGDVQGAPLRLSRHERELLENALAFGKLVADDVAVPRADIIAVPEKSKFAKVIQMFSKTHHSRLPVMGRDLDDMKGFVLLKDVVAFIGREDEFTLQAVLRPLPVVPETLPLPKVLQSMRRAKVPLVLVSDEFGGVSGLISLKDILEQLVGVMDDESAVQDEAVMSLGHNRYRVRGDAELDVLDRVLGVHFARHASDDVVTLAGLVMQLAQRIPDKGDSIALFDGWKAVVFESDGRRILRLDLERVG